MTIPMDNTSREACLDQFPGITAEIRVMIYKAYLNDFEKVRLGRVRPAKVQWQRYPGVPSLCGFSAWKFSAGGRKRKSTSPTREQARDEAARRTVLDSICKTHLDTAHAEEPPITPGAVEAFQQYKLEHDMYVDRCWHERHHVNAGDPLEIHVNERGHLCDDLPMLALANRQMFAEVFAEFFPRVKDKSPEGSRFSVTVQNFNLFPFFRFCQMLGRGDWRVGVPAHMVDVNWHDDVEQGNDELGLRKFAILKRLVELHWLKGIPIWTCFTKSPVEEYEGGTVPDILYSVRQIVALQRAEPAQWKHVSIEYIRKCEMTEVSCVPQADWQSLTTSELAEAIIETIMLAIEYRMGYKGSFSCLTRDGHDYTDDWMPMDYRFQGENAKVAYEKEHAAVHLFNLYRKKVDAVLRVQLGDDYEAWEKLPDNEKLPQDVVF